MFVHFRDCAAVCYLPPDGNRQIISRLPDGTFAKRNEMFACRNFCSIQWLRGEMLRSADVASRGDRRDVSPPVKHCRSSDRESRWNDWCNNRILRSCEKWSSQRCSNDRSSGGRSVFSPRGFRSFPSGRRAGVGKRKARHDQPMRNGQHRRTSESNQIAA